MRRWLVLGLALAASAALAGGVVAERTNTHPLAATVALGPASGAPVVDEGAGRAFVADHVDGYLRMFDARTGRLLCLLAIGRDGPMAVDEKRGLVYLAGAWNGPDKYGVYNDHATLRVIDARTGHLLRTMATGVSEDAVALAVDAARGRLFMVFPGTALVLDTRRGVVLGAVSVDSGADQVAVDERSGHAFVVDGGANSVSILDARQGTLLRTVAVGAEPAGVAVDARAGHVFVPTADGIDVLDARSGALWRTIGAGRRFEAIGVDSRTGHAFAADAGSDSIAVLDTRSGAVIRTVRIGRAPDVVVIDEPSGRVFVASQGGSTRAGPTGAGVSVLDAGSGAVLRTIAVGDVIGAAVDARSGHAFVVSRDDGSVAVPDPWRWLPSWLRSRLPFVAAPPARRPPHTSGVTAVLNVLDASS